MEIGDTLTTHTKLFYSYGWTYLFRLQYNYVWSCFGWTVAIVAQWSYIDNSGQVNFSKILCTTTRSGCHDGKCSPTLPRAHSLPLSLMNHTSQQQQFVAWVLHLMLVDQSEADTEIAREMSWHHHRYKSSTNTTMVQFSPAMLPGTTR